MTVRDIGAIIESWAPKEVAWEDDNVGLQCGDGSQSVRSLLIGLDPTEAMINEAARKSVQMLVTHHPLLFRPLRRVDLESSTGRILRRLMESGIALYAAHTNLDASPMGTSHALAQAMGLIKPTILNAAAPTEKKIVTFVPPSHVEVVAEALARAGAGTIGKYERCSFRSEGIGTFIGDATADPAIGKAGRYEHAREIRLEMIVPHWRLGAAIAALLGSHPYEEPAFDVYPLENPGTPYGLGVIGDLRRPVSLPRFLRTLKRQLHVPVLRHSPGTGKPVQRVAACGGSGGMLLDEAIRAGADAFVTADVKYHSFHDAFGRIVLVDAGHFETENPVVAALASRLRKEFLRRGEAITIRTATTPANPVRYV